MKEELFNKIISVAYGDANLFDRIKINRLAKQSDEVKNILESYRATASEVHKLSEEEFPEELIPAIERKTAKLKKQTNMFAFDLYTIIFKRPVISAGATVVLLGAIIFGIISNRTIEYKYTPEQVSAADIQARKAFAIIGRIFDQTNTTLKEEVFNSRVAKPINDGVGVVNGLFTTQENFNRGESR